MTFWWLIALSVIVCIAAACIAFIIGGRTKNNQPEKDMRNVSERSFSKIICPICRYENSSDAFF